MSEKLKIISLSINHLNFSEALSAVVQLGLSHTPSYICFANAHMTIEAYKDKSFRHDLDNATLVLPDGKSVAVAAKMIHGEKQERIAGMDFMPALLEEANKNGSTVFFYGSTSKVLSTLDKKIQEDYPRVNIGGMISPP
ncbi:MAG TPA: WecB/TagA/CpsF family glycosyltransferase, partial [Chitinophagaceae bacterium]|nr:WecB/TagA/CpsF family glycosyltransferase [Chitinophagaceae bacterium]